MCIQKWYAIYNVYTHLHIDAYFHFGFYYCCCWTTTYAVAFHSLFSSLALSLSVSVPPSLGLCLSPYDTLKHFGVNILWANILRTRAHLLVCSPCTQPSIYLLSWFWFQFSFPLHFGSVVTVVHFGGFPPAFSSLQPICAPFFCCWNFSHIQSFSLYPHYTYTYITDIFILSL